MDERDLKETENLRRIYTRQVAERRTPDSSRCVAPEAILAVLQREGSEESRLATLDHVMSCAACHREYELLSAVNEAAEESAGSAARRGAWWRGTPLALAASLVAAIGAGLLVHDQIRHSEPIRGEPGDIALVAPAATAPAASGLTFVWRAAPGATGYVLEVQRADGSIAFADTTTDTTLALSNRLPPAEYRWWVRELTDGAEPRSSELRPLEVALP
jgi:hypothetical protein